MFLYPPRTHRGFPVLDGGVPLLGHLLRLGEDQPLLFERAAATLGSQYFMHTSRWVLVCTGASGFELLKNKTTTSEHYVETAGQFIGASLLGVDGAPHRRMRGAMNGSFTPRGITSSGAAEIAATVIEERVSAFPDDGVVIHDETQTLALHIIFRVLDIPASDLAAWTAKYQQFLLTLFPVPIDLPFTPRRRGREAGSWLDDRIRGLFAGAARNAERSGILAALLDATDDAGDGLTERELIDNLKLLALAGHETTASTMAWAALMIARHPEHFDRLVEESRTAPGIPRSPKDLERHRFAEALFREALRLYPPIGMVTRQVLSPMRVGAFDAQQGDLLAIPLSLYGRDPDVYPDPDRFDPTRWLGRTGPIPAVETAAFGGGPHFCLGYHFAWLEVVQFVVAFARTLDARGQRPRLAPGTDLERRYKPFCQPRKGCRILFEAT